MLINTRSGAATGNSAVYPLCINIPGNLTNVLVVLIAKFIAYGDSTRQEQPIPMQLRQCSISPKKDAGSFITYWATTIAAPILRPVVKHAALRKS
jgi:hypothetical protein